MLRPKSLLIFVLSIFVLFSCGKEAISIETNENVIETDAIEATVTDLTAEFIQNEKSVKGDPDWWDSSARVPDWLVVALVDVIGGAVGTLISSPLG